VSFSRASECRTALYRANCGPVQAIGSGVTETEVPPDNLQSYSCYQRLAYIGRIEFYSIRFMFLSRWGWYNPFQ
jgi:hypothetical protein